MAELEVLRGDDVQATTASHLYNVGLNQNKKNTKMLFVVSFAKLGLFRRNLMSDFLSRRNGIRMSWLIQ
jgi:hypothetical protein